MDGFKVVKIEEAVATLDILITATGKFSLLSDVKTYKTIMK